MTTHNHEPSVPIVDPGADGSAPPERHESSSARRWWLLPGLIAGLLAAGLVIAGVVSPSTVISAALFGGIPEAGRPGPAAAEASSQDPLIGRSGAPLILGLRAR